MSNNLTINASLLSLGAFFIGMVPTFAHDNFWYAAISAVIGIGSFIVYELLP